MSAFKEMFSEDSKFSLMRAMSGSIVLVSLGIIVYQAAACDSVDWMGCCSLCALGLGGKGGQKYIENLKDQNSGHEV